MRYAAPVALFLEGCWRLPNGANACRKARTAGTTRVHASSTNLAEYVIAPKCDGATQAVSAENPNPPTDAQRSKQTVLQQHVDFWDADRDGKCALIALLPCSTMSVVLKH